VRGPHQISHHASIEAPPISNLWAAFRRAPAFQGCFVTHGPHGSGVHPLEAQVPRSHHLPTRACAPVVSRTLPSWVPRAVTGSASQTSLHISHSYKDTFSASEPALILSSPTVGSTIQRERTISSRSYDYALSPTTELSLPLPPCHYST